MRELRKYLLIPLGISLIAIIIIFSTGFFEIRFYPGTMINGVDVSFKTPEAADWILSRQVSSYVLLLNERGNEKEQIKGSEIGLKLGAESSSIKKEQNEKEWFLSYFGKSAIHFANAYTFDENLLKDRFSRLDCFDESKVIEPKNASLVYSNGAYQIIKEEYGNKIDEAKLYSIIIGAVTDGKTELDLEELECYENPRIRSDSHKIMNTKATAEDYLDSRIIYTFPVGSELVDEDEISKWIGFDDNLTIVFNTKEMKTFLKYLSDKYNTCGKIRDFATSMGTRIKVGGGDYGWKIDIRGETDDLINDVASCKITEKEPKYIQRGAVFALNDIGSTYVEINLTAQYLWYYKDGTLITHGNVVTGDVSDGYKTPEGIYSLKYRIKNAVLRGEDYQAKVNYWMPFNNDIGLHDASWRSQFGGNIYLNNGSHGCINAPYYLAEEVFNNITVGTPVVCYY